MKTLSIFIVAVLVVGCSSSTNTPSANQTTNSPKGFWWSNDADHEYLLDVRDTNATFVNRTQQANQPGVNDTMYSSTFSETSDSIRAWFIPTPFNATYLSLGIGSQLTGIIEDSNRSPGITIDTISFSKYP